ncbi:MAG: hypothetical protein GX780_00160 [Campylobacteraceae bacterium]|nr:hypothetical protein [Campylobacteraceae bacterium]
MKNAFPNALVDLVIGSSGTFDVHVNGKRIFSKQDPNSAHYKKFPEPGELINLIDKMGF